MVKVIEEGLDVFGGGIQVDFQRGRHPQPKALSQFREGSFRVGFRQQLRAGDGEFIVFAQLVLVQHHVPDIRIQVRNHHQFLAGEFLLQSRSQLQ